MSDMNEKYINRIVCGNTLELLKELEDNSIDEIITSPPYWGLRSYGKNAETTWDGDPNCEHEQKWKGQLGLEPSIEMYIGHLMQITAELKRVLKPSGILFWNHGDSYCGSQGHYNAKNKRAREGRLIPDWKGYQKKCLHLQSYRLVMKMIDEQGWILRNVIIWYKPNHMPSPTKDRFTNAYEPIFMLTKKKRYWFDLDAVRIPSKGSNNFSEKNPSDVWKIPTQPFPEAHFAAFPEKLIERMILAGCPEWICRNCGKARARISKSELVDGKLKPRTNEKYSAGSEFMSEKTRLRSKMIIVEKGWTDCGCNAGWESGVILDPFMGAGTTALAALKNNRRFVGFEINPEYVEMAYRRIKPYLVQEKLP